MVSEASTVRLGGWTRSERVRIGGIVAVVAGLHVIGWSLYLFFAHGLAGAGAFAGAGTLAYSLGIRHAFDADHIAAIDDTTRLMMQRGRRPVGVGFFFALGHSTVVFVLALVVAAAAGAAGSRVDSFRHAGGMASQAIAMTFLLLVATLNALVLAGVLQLWRRLSRRELTAHALDLLLVNQGLLNRILGRRARNVIRSSWHMYPVGILFGLGLETASEVTLLALSASTASQGRLPALAVLTLPVLFAAGMTGFDTADGLLMSRAYSWAHRSPARRLYYNAATTAMTVLVAAFIGSVYLAGLLVEGTGAGGVIASYAGLSAHFQVVGYLIVALFVTAWCFAAAAWRLLRLGERYAE